MSLTQIWDIIKYARYVENPVPGASQGKGEWKSYEEVEKSIKLAILPDHLVLSGTSNVLESFSLMDAHTHVRGIRKGDSFLIVYRIGTGSRRFRVRFQSSAGKSGFCACSECHQTLAKYFPWKDLEADSESSTQILSSQLFSSQGEKPTDTTFSSSQMLPQVRSQQYTGATAPPIEGSHPLSDLAEMLTTPEASFSSLYSGTNYPIGLIRYFIQVCLTDPSFPGFVKKVEEEFEHLTGKSDIDATQNK